MDRLNFDRLRAKIAETRKRLDEQERALDLVEEMTKMSDFAQSTLPGLSEPSEVVPIHAVKRITRVSASKAKKLERPPQKQLLKEAIDKLGGDEFTVNMVNEVLIKDGNKFDGHKPQNRIAVLLSVLLDEGYVVLTQQGGGNVPKKYRKVDQEAENPLL